MIFCTCCSVDVPVSVPERVWRNASSGEVVSYQEVLDAASSDLVEALMRSDMEGTPPPAVPGFVCAEEEVEGTSSEPKVFDGTEEQAEAEGWLQNEFGWVCRDCSGEEPVIGGVTFQEEETDVFVNIALKASLGAETLKEHQQELAEALYDFVNKESETEPS